MGKPNYSFEKRKKELERKLRQEEKAQRKSTKGAGSDDEKETDPVHSDPAHN